MRTTAIGLLIWLVIMLSERILCMEGPPITGQIMATAALPKTDQQEVEPIKQLALTWPTLYSEDAIKKARKEGYRAGMQDSNQVIIALEADRQRFFTQDLDFQKTITQARDKLDQVLKSISQKQMPHIVQLQDILALLNQATESSSK